LCSQEQIDGLAVDVDVVGGIDVVAGVAGVAVAVAVE
jgi:hypothetical protein